MTALQVACQVATGYRALCGMKLLPVAITDFSCLGRRNYARKLSSDLPARTARGQF